MKREKKNSELAKLLAVFLYQILLIKVGTKIA